MSQNTTQSQKTTAEEQLLNTLLAKMKEIDPYFTFPLNDENKEKLTKEIWLWNFQKNMESPSK